MSEALLKALTEGARELGVELMGVAPVPQSSAEGGWFEVHEQRLIAWVEAGAHAEMDWITTQLDKRRDPQLLLPGARSALVLWMGHRFEPPPRPAYATARVATYAWGRDYHNILRRVVRQLSKVVSAHEPEARTHGSVDTSPLLERAFAERARVGWIGRSTMLIHPQRGTYGSLAVLLTTAELPVSAFEPHPFRCGTCTDCWSACPTGALSAQGLDARKCISYWTIEHRGLIPREVRSPLGEWVFGCDICQEVCPWNNKAPVGGEAARALWQPQEAHIWPDLHAWLEMSDEGLNEALLGSPLRRAHPEGLKRNALIALANQGDTSALTLIEAQLSHPSEVVQLTALWALISLLTPPPHEPLSEAQTASVARLEAWCRAQLSGERSAEAREELTWALGALSALSAQAHA